MNLGSAISDVQGQVAISQQQLESQRGTGCSRRLAFVDELGRFLVRLECEGVDTSELSVQYAGLKMCLPQILVAALLVSILADPL
jgi:hypothetical protein